MPTGSQPVTGRNWRIARWLLAAAVVMLAACAAAPVQEMSDARQAVMAAEQAGAEEHAPERLNEARNHLARAQQSLEVRDYDEAREYATRARESAVRALTATEAVRGSDAP